MSTASVLVQVPGLTAVSRTRKLVELKSAYDHECGHATVVDADPRTYVFFVELSAGLGSRTVGDDQVPAAPLPHGFRVP